MKRLSTLRSCMFAVVGTVIATPAMLGNLITPGTTVTPDTFPTATYLNGATLLASITGTVNPAPPTSFNATYTESVYANPNNTQCSGCLDFVVNLTNAGPGIIERISLGGNVGTFVGFVLDVGYLSPTTNVTPASVDRSSGGGVVGFQYLGSGITAGQSTATLIVETNARSYSSGTVSVQDGVAGFGNGFAPTSTPEPISAFLLGGGLLALGSAKRFFGRKTRS